jgi:hypothetical protein
VVCSIERVPDIVMAGLDPAIHRIKIFEIIWSQLFVGWIAGSSPAMTESGFSHDAHNSRALLNENDDSRRVFSSRISERVSGGSARWLQSSRSQRRQLTPIGVPWLFSRSKPPA